MASLGRNDLIAARRHADGVLRYSTSGQLGLALTVMSMLDTLIHLIGGEFERAERSYSTATEQMAVAGGANAFAAGVIGRFVTRLAAGRPQDIPELTAVYEAVPKDMSELLVRALIAEGRHEEARAFWEPGWQARLDYYWLIRLALRAENALALGDREVSERCYRELLPGGQFRGQSGQVADLAQHGSVVDLESQQFGVAISGLSSVGALLPTTMRRSAYDLLGDYMAATWW